MVCRGLELSGVTVSTPVNEVPETPHEGKVYVTTIGEGCDGAAESDSGRGPPVATTSAWETSARGASIPSTAPGEARFSCSARWADKTLPSWALDIDSSQRTRLLQWGNMLLNVTTARESTYLFSPWKDANTKELAARAQRSAPRNILRVVTEDTEPEVGDDQRAKTSKGGDRDKNRERR